MRAGQLRSPIVWFGGKGNLDDWIVSHLPPHRHYVEPFGGGASVLLAKPPVELEVYNDIDHALYEFFLTLSDQTEFERFYRRVAVLPWSRELYNECHRTWQEQTERHERVWRWFVVARQSFSGHFGHSWGSAVTATCRKMAKTTSRWLSIIEMLPEIHARLQRVQIECADWRDILARYDTSETLFYLDPPYVKSTRRAGEYKHEMSEQDHIELVEHLLRIEGMAVLSGYPNELYRPLEDAGWRRVDRLTACYAAGRTRGTGVLGKGTALRMQQRTESLWIKPVPLRGLFDYQPEGDSDALEHVK